MATNKQAAAYAKRIVELEASCARKDAALRKITQVTEIEGASDSDMLNEAIRLTRAALAESAPAAGPVHDPVGMGWVCCIHGEWMPDLKHSEVSHMDPSKAAAFLGRRGGQAGTGAAKRRGGTTDAEVSAYMSALAKKRKKPDPFRCTKCGEPIMYGERQHVCR